MILVDAHADLAYNMRTFGRDYTRAAAETRQQEIGSHAPQYNGDTLLGYPDWVRGRVGVVFATLFASPARKREGPWETQSYADPREAHALYSSQLEAYHRLTGEAPDRFRMLTDRRGLHTHLAEWEDPTSEPPVGLVILMEGADGVRAPQEIADWHARGVRIVGPAWAGTRYAGGTGEPGPLTQDGRRLLQEMEPLAMILDLSHLAEEAAQESLERYDGTVIATHANPRALMSGSRYPERHLSDEVLAGLIDRGGVAGIVLYNRFLKAGWTPEEGRAVVPLARVAEHIDYVCQMAGNAQHVGIGSDFDGGFGVQEVPEGLDTVADLRFIGEMLTARGYPASDVEAILGGNWLGLLARALPET